jgi:hypothetical protein
MQALQRASGLKGMLSRSNQHQQSSLFHMFNIYSLASSILGGVILTLFANAASGKLPNLLRKLGDILSSGTVSMLPCGIDFLQS